MVTVMVRDTVRDMVTDMVRDTVKDMVTVMVRDTVRDMVRDVGCCNLLHFSHSYNARIKFLSSTPPFQNNL